MTLRTWVRGVGEVLITVGVVLLLFVGYELWWTNVVADRAVAAERAELLDRFGQPPHPSPDSASSKVVPGDAFALMYIPAIERSWVRPVVEGVTLEDLSRGVGHYPQTAMPGQVGNFAVAGHRATNGQPFAYLDRVTTGDQVIVQTQTRWYVYRVTDVSLVAPTDVDGIAPVPGDPTATPDRRIITLTTCNPRWASYERLILHGRLVSSSPAADPPPIPGGG